MTGAPDVIEFLQGIRRGSATVHAEGMRDLYVRRGSRIIGAGDAARVERDVITIANVKAAQPGNGAFKALVERMKKAFPRVGIMVELVHNPRFAAGLRRWGWEEFRADPEDAPNFYLAPERQARP